MSWFKLFTKKTNPSSPLNSEDYDLLDSKEKLGVFVHSGEGNYCLVLAPFWNENLLLDAVKSERKITSLILLNGLKQGKLPLKKLFEVHQISTELPIYLSDLENTNEALSHYNCLQLPDNLKLGITNFHFQHGTHFIHADIERTISGAALHAYIGIDLQYHLPAESNPFDVRLKDTWFIGNIDFTNSSETATSIFELGLRKKIIVLQFRDWIKANGESEGEAFNRMGYDYYFIGQNEPK